MRPSYTANDPCIIDGNVPNTALIDNFPARACVEVPCHVDGSGIYPEHSGLLPAHLAALDAPHLAAQELVVRAALQHRSKDVYYAAMLDPLVGAALTLEQIWRMVDEMIAAHSAFLPDFA